MIDILLLGEQKLLAEIKPKLQSKEIGQVLINETLPLQEVNLVIDTRNNLSFETLNTYWTTPNLVVALASVTKSLHQLTASYPFPLQCHLIGLNTLPTFLQRSIWEISLFDKQSQLAAEQVLHKLAIPYRWVADRVGMVTPRIIAMIINEACYTVQEQTATMEAIDKAMKLGTRYPYGPFEWGDKIGLQNVYEVLASLYEDTKEERFKICPLLKNKYLRREKFYS